MSLELRKFAILLFLPLLGCGSPTVETDTPSDEPPQSCFHDNGAWCITTSQVAITQETERSVHWTFRDSLDNTGLIVEPPGCRGQSADGVYRRTSGTVLREGANWKITRIGLREDRTCELLFMAPESAVDSLENVFLAGVNVCLAGTDCGSSGNVLAARVGTNGIF